MRNELPRYPKHELSESEWVGELPDGWRTIRLSRVNTKLTNGFVGPTRDILRDKGVRYLQSLHIKGNRILFDTPYYVSEEWSKKHSKSVLKAGDVLIVQTGDIGQVAVVDERFAGCNCHALIIVTSKPKYIAGPFLSAVLNSNYGYHSLKSVQTGALHPHLNCTIIRDLFIPVPPIDQQRSILAFLDVETGKIDRLMGVRRRQIEVLREQRAAVIHHAVTQGLAPAAPMKDSGIEWLGDIPAHWTVHRLRRTTDFPVNGLWGDDASGGDDDIICIRVADFDRLQRRISDGDKTIRAIPEQKRKRRLLNKGDLLLEKSGGGEQQTVGVVVLFDKGYPAVSSNFVAKLTPRTGFDPRFLCLVHETLYCVGVTKLSVKQTTGIQNLDSHWYLDESCAFPSISEQHEIVVHIDRETAKIDALIGKYERELALLEEYRASLISHAVTGKIDVRGLVGVPTSEEGVTA